MERNQLSDVNIFCLFVFLVEEDDQGCGHTHQGDGGCLKESPFLAQSHSAPSNHYSFGYFPGIPGEQCRLCLWKSLKRRQKSILIK